MLLPAIFELPQGEETEEEVIEDEGEGDEDAKRSFKLSTEVKPSIALLQKQLKAQGGAVFEDTQ